MTTRYVEHKAYLIARRDGVLRLRSRRPAGLAHDEYAFELLLRVPFVERPVLAGRLELELPGGVDPDVQALAEVSGPLPTEED